MFWTTIVILCVCWALGLVTGYTGSGLIHILPMLAVAVMLVRWIDVLPKVSFGANGDKGSQKPGN